MLLPSRCRGHNPRRVGYPPGSRFQRDRRQATLSRLNRSMNRATLASFALVLNASAGQSGTSCTNAIVTCDTPASMATTIPDIVAAIVPAASATTLDPASAVSALAPASAATAAASAVEPTASIRAPDSNPTRALPRTAAIFYGVLGTSAKQQQVARFGLVITNLYGSQAYMQGVIDTMRQVNPDLKLGSYTISMEHKDPAPAATQSIFPGLQTLNANDWWVRDAFGARKQASAEYGGYVVNQTAWAPIDASGRRWPQWLAQHHTSLLGGLNGLDYIFVDTVFYQPRVDADWKRNSTNQSRTDPEIQAATRRGQADYFAALSALNPTKKIMGNADNDLSYPEYRGKLHGAMLECGYGKSWSLETRYGWEKMMTEYRNMLANTKAPKDVILMGCSPNGLDLNALRYGLASALMEDGWFSYTITSDEPYYADEYSAPLGSAAEPPPTAPTASGIWMRKYTNGIALVNPGKKTASVEIGPGYKRLAGAQDPETNSGRPISSVTLLPRQGIIVIKQ